MDFMPAWGDHDGSIRCLVQAAERVPGEGVRMGTVVPAPGTWINQQQLIDGQRNDLFRPLVLDPRHACFQTWQRAGHGLVTCP